MRLSLLLLLLLLLKLLFVACGVIFSLFTLLVGPFLLKRMLRLPLPVEPHRQLR
jgi:hypothetical protein